jgi:UDP-3-O-[3-hydroxymyristoyl] glucosamine N-acyltransferase
MRLRASGVERRASGVSPLASVHPSAVLGTGVRIAPFTYVGERVRIGDDSRVEPGVTILADCELGRRVTVGAGTVLGINGFGYERGKDGYRFIPHRGRVIIEDDVEIGANCTIARARRTETRIGAGTKIDALVHIAHNVSIGRNCIIIAQCGIAGSVRLGDNVILAGQTGIKDHVTVGDNSIVYAKSALYRSIPANSRYSGIPARPHRAGLRLLAQKRRQAK